eukprot:CAMPEP_0170477212 /NCGR_PEP_ID=MMETSP0123-20130129/18532_1 /TAXON_ID=182087 /ORGANISM="Favella ehrenbergii, Strain Fehren 1" /LENGTH=44 /DNA_ID= /DNA_START= /DNA_END= /DNA_ORIENTATION=
MKAEQRFLMRSATQKGVQQAPELLVKKPLSRNVGMPLPSSSYTA